MPKLKFAKVSLQTRVLDSLDTFYSGVLGLPTSRGANRLNVQCGWTELVFEQGDVDAIYHFAFNIPENQLESARSWLADRIDVSEIFHFESWNAHAFYFSDPSGNILEFIARHDLPNAAVSWEGASSILCMSEIGLVVPDVLATAERVKSSLSLQEYRPGSPDFTALGDEQALLILVREGREWFASRGLVASSFPLKVQMTGCRGAYRDDLNEIIS